MPLPVIEFFAISAALSLSVFAQSTPRTSLLALSKQDHTLSIIDPATLKIVATIPVGNDPHEVTASSFGRGSEDFDVTPDGHEAWVANALDGTISIVDLNTRSVMATLAANVPGTNRLKFRPDGKLVFVTPGSVLVIIDPATHKEVKRLSNVHGSGGIQMQPYGARAYVACGRDNYASVIDLKTLEEVGRIPIASPDGLAWALQR